MSFQERRAIVSMISSLLIAAVYFAYVLQRAQADGVDMTQDFRFWATSIVILIPVSIVAQIVIHIVFSILNAIATREEEAGFMDERDMLIELKASRNALYTFTFGFMLAMIALVLGQPPSAMFITLIVGGVASELVSGISQLYFYRRGV